MKSILLINTPDSCEECPLFFDGLACYITETVIGDEVKAHDCPLRKLPQKQIANDYNFNSYANGVAQGYNHCIDDITGEQYKPPKYKE